MNTFAVLLCRWLVRTYPREFREAFGEEIIQTYRDQLRPIPTHFGRMCHALPLLMDILWSGLRERKETMQRNNLDLLLLAMAALFIGGMITWIDTLPFWDDTGITAGAVFIACALFGALRPERPWLFALLIGGWIPLIGILKNHNNGTILALVVAFVGAYAGSLLRRLLTGTPDTV